jgi:MFS family permease
VSAESAETKEESTKAAFSELFRDGRTPYSLLVLMGVCLHALQVLVTAIIMPTIVADIGGATYYTWPAMVYTIGAIVGAASVGPLWNRFGPRKAYALSGAIFLVATACSALAPSMGWLIAARGLQGTAGGLVVGGGMALIVSLFEDRYRTRLLAMYQGTWMVAWLLGPVVGGIFAEIGWWRGSFWAMSPFVLILVITAWFYIPDRFDTQEEAKPDKPFPIRRLAILTSGVFCIALAGPIEIPAYRVTLIIAGIGLLWLTFRMDRASENRLYPSDAFSLRTPVGLGMWIVLIVGIVQTTIHVFLPLLLQVVHGVSPIYISYIAMVMSLGWTAGTFMVSGWSGEREKLALWTGPLVMMAGLAGIILTAQLPLLSILTAATFVMGFGVGTHNVHLLSRTMAAAAPGDERVTASAIPSLRSLGTALGAAVSGVLSTIAGLGDATSAETVGPAITFVYSANLVWVALAAIFMFMLLRPGLKSGASDAQAAARDNE